MSRSTPNPKKRDFLLPPGCKDLIHVLQGAPPKPSLAPFLINEKIRASSVRVIGDQDEQLGIMPLADALALARSRKIDLVEIASTAKPPICCLVDFSKFRDEVAGLRKKKS